MYTHIVHVQNLGARFSKGSSKQIPMPYTPDKTLCFYIQHETGKMFTFTFLTITQLF